MPLRDVLAGYGDTVWPASGVPVSAVRLLGADPAADLAEQAHDADTRLRAAIAAWPATHPAAR